MSQFRFIPDPQYPNAVTIVTPLDQRVRLTEHPDRRLRFRAARMGPALIQEFYGTGEGEDVIISIVPEGWAKKEHGTFPRPIADTITNSRKLESIADAVVADITGLTFQLGRLVNEPAEEDVAGLFPLAVKYIEDISANLDSSRFLIGMKGDLSTNLSELKALGQLTRVKGSIAYAIQLWTGKNHTKRNISDLFDEAKALFDRAINPEDVGKAKLSIHAKTKIGKLDGYKHIFTNARASIIETQANALELHGMIVRDGRG